MQSLADCPELVFPTVAGFYAQLTAVLAGFAFAAIITLVTFRRTGAAASLDENVDVTFVAALMALILESLGYSILAGEPFPDARGRSATDEILLGGPFILAFMMLFYGLSIAVTQGSNSRAIRVTMSIVSVVILPTLTFLLVMNSFAYYSTTARELVAEPNACIASELIPKPELTLDLLILPVTVVSLVLAAAMPFWRRWLRRIRVVPAMVTIVYSSVAMVAIGYVGGQPSDFLFDDETVNVLAISLFVAVSICSIIMAADILSKRVAQSNPRNMDGRPNDVPMGTADSDVGH